MRGFNAVILIVLLIGVSVTLPINNCSAQERHGKIIFQDGSVVDFTWIEAFKDSFQYLKNLGDLSSREVKISIVSKIEFTNLTDLEQSIVKQKGYGAMKKAKIEFRDGTVYQNVYTNVAIWHWKNNYEEGNLQDAKSIIFEQRVSETKECPKCSRHFNEADWKYCPFDGTLLK
jgi:hypothetical protein